MYMALILVSIVFVLIAAVLTIFALNQEDKKIQKYKSDGSTHEEALKRSHEYEKASISAVIPIQLWVYGIGAFLTVVLIVAFAMYY